MSNSMQNLRGATRLLFDYIGGVTGVVEQMHETIARRPMPWSSRPQEPTSAHGPIASNVYSIVRGVNGALREGVDRSLKFLPQSATGSVDDVKRAAAANGICGNHLEATDNPLAIDMCFTTLDEVIEPGPVALKAAFPNASPDLVVFVHGLCLTEHSWERDDNPAIGKKLDGELDTTSVYLRYNTGRHISTNGQDLAKQLDDLCAAWPVPVKSISLVGHSMGGLVVRSACWYAEANSQSWLRHLQRVVCLGTPHHGAPLEKASNLLDAALQSNQYVEPLLFGRHRSVGIKDLRHGNLLDEDWQGEGAIDSPADLRRPVPLIPDVDYYFVAATVGRDENGLSGQLLGDLLVRLGSATGQHSNELQQISVKPENCRVFFEMNHFGLLNEERVHQQLMDWFTSQVTEAV